MNFSALLIHEQIFKSRINKILAFFNWVINFKNKFLVFKFYAIGIFIYFICISIDYLRLLLFKFLKIRNFSLMLDKNILEK